MCIVNFKVQYQQLVPSVVNTSVFRPQLKNVLIIIIPVLILHDL